MKPQKYKFAEGIERKDSNDCTVVALSNMCDIPYDDAFSILSRNGRKPGKGFHFYFFLIKHNYKILGKQLIKLPVEFKTLNQFLELNLEGNFLIFVRQHVLVIKNNQIHDTFFKNYRIKHVFLIKDIPNE